MNFKIKYTSKPVYLKIWAHNFPTGNLVSCLPRYGYR